jgi:hypothetical protein
VANQGARTPLADCPGLFLSCAPLSASVFGDLRSVVVEHKEANGRRQVRMASVRVNACHKVRCGHSPLLRYHNQFFPELVLNAHTRLVAGNVDTVPHDRRFHGFMGRLGDTMALPQAGTVAHLALRLLVIDDVNWARIK